MRTNPQPAGPFDPRDFSFSFGSAPAGPHGPFGHPRGRAAKAMRRQFRDAMRASMSDRPGETGDRADAPGRPDSESGGERRRGRGPRGERRGGPLGGPLGGPFGGRRGGPGHHGPHDPFSRGPRAGRGDIRAGVLALLAEQPRHGYEIIQELSARSGGAWRPSPGSIYPTLKHLHHEGLVTADKGEGRRVFQLTDAGRTYVDEHADELVAPWDTVGSAADDAVEQLRDLTGQVAAAVVQVAQAGSPEQVTAAADLLTRTRRALYRILAEDAEDGE